MYIGGGCGGFFKFVFNFRFSILSFRFNITRQSGISGGHTFCESVKVSIAEIYMHEIYIKHSSDRILSLR